MIHNLTKIKKISEEASLCYWLMFYADACLYSWHTPLQTASDY